MAQLRLTKTGSYPVAKLRQAEKKLLENLWSISRWHLEVANSVSDWLSFTLTRSSPVLSPRQEAPTDPPTHLLEVSFCCFQCQIELITGGQSALSLQQSQPCFTHLYPLQRILSLFAISKFVSRSEICQSRSCLSGAEKLVWNQKEISLVAEYFRAVWIP